MSFIFFLRLKVSKQAMVSVQQLRGALCPLLRLT